MRLGLALGALALIVVLWATGAGAAMTAEPIAVMQGLDKITARISRFDLPVGKPAMFFTLSVVVRDCERSAPAAPLGGPRASRPDPEPGPRRHRHRVRPPRAPHLTPHRALDPGGAPAGRAVP